MVRIKALGKFVAALAIASTVSLAGMLPGHAPEVGFHWCFIIHSLSLSTIESSWRADAVRYGTPPTPAPPSEGEDANLTRTNPMAVAARRRGPAAIARW